MSHPILNRYTALAIAGQFVSVAVIWIGTLMLPPTEGRYFELMIYFYLPVIFLFSFLPGRGEFGAILVGLPCGIVVYGLIFGLVFSFLNGRRRESGK